MRCKPRTHDWVLTYNKNKNTVKKKLLYYQEEKKSLFKKKKIGKEPFSHSNPGPGDKETWSIPNSLNSCWLSRNNGLGSPLDNQDLCHKELHL